MFMHVGFDRSYNCLVFWLHIKTITFYFELSMKQSFENENIYDVFMNEVSTKDEPLQKLEKNANVQIEGNRKPKNNEKKMILFWKKLHAQKIIF